MRDCIVQYIAAESIRLQYCCNCALVDWKREFDDAKHNLNNLNCIVLYCIQLYCREGRGCRGRAVACCMLHVANASRMFVWHSTVSS
jgi:hypothetical protein